jgi:hypothetical protein
MQILVSRNALNRRRTGGVAVEAVTAVLNPVPVATTQRARDGPSQDGAHSRSAQQTAATTRTEEIGGSMSNRRKQRNRTLDQRAASIARVQGWLESTGCGRACRHRTSVLEPPG